MGFLLIKVSVANFEGLRICTKRSVPAVRCGTGPFLALEGRRTLVCLVALGWVLCWLVTLHQPALLCSYFHPSGGVVKGNR